ncbi:hypothetical protein ACFQY8_00730 [Alloscardovia venturai]|uniref:Peptide ABC transporter permease n=1 Tax=Alloscardovia venturai TaxID=1769421 RepID=A0ABW2Y896_9BIFI
MAVRNSGPRGARSRGNRATTAHPRVKGTKRKLARKYLIRRVVALVIAIAVLALVGVGIFAVTHRGRSAASSALSATSSSTKKTQKSQSSTSSDSSSQGNFTTQKAKDSGIPDCSTNQLKLTLSADSTAVSNDSTIKFTKTFTHQGNQNCLIDTSDDNTVLVVTNAQGTQVYRSDACTVDPGEILLGQSDTYTKDTSWATAVSNTAVDKSIADNAEVNASGHGCMKSGKSAPHVAAGEYTAQLIDATDNSVVSDPVKLTISAPQATPQTSEQSEQSTQNQ